MFFLSWLLNRPVPRVCINIRKEINKNQTMEKDGTCSSLHIHLRSSAAGGDQNVKGKVNVRVLKTFALKHDNILLYDNSYHSRSLPYYEL